MPEPVVRKLGPLERYGLRVTLLAAAVVLVAIPFGLLLEQVLRDGPLTVADHDVAVWLNRNVSAHPLVVDLLQFVSFLGKPIFLLFAVGIPGVWIAWRREWRLVVFLVVTCVGGGVVDTAVKLAVGRSRPVVDSPVATAFGKSFPSGHSMASTVCYGAVYLVLVALLSRRVRRFVLSGLIVLVLAIGTSRLALGLHFVSDVLGGYVLGLAWLAASVAAFEIWRQDRGRRPTHPLKEGVEPEETRDLATVP